MPRSARAAIRFWLSLATETFGRRRLDRLINVRLGGIDPLVIGGWHLPTYGPFVLAANHYKGAATTTVIAAVAAAAGTSCPRVGSDLLIVVGQRQRKANSHPLSGLGRRVYDFACRRWCRHVLRLPLGNALSSVRALRPWRDAARSVPSLVFPEGVSRLRFGRVRPGAGRWLSALGVPTIPVAGGWGDGRWWGRFGPPVSWAARTELRDAQLGLCIAELLPPDLSVNWQEALASWNQAWSRPAESADNEESAAPLIASAFVRPSSSGDYQGAQC